jgi:two-component system LytT family response regulator
LKPFDRSRFQQALGRAKEQVRLRAAERMQPQLEALLENARGPHLKRLAVRESGRISFLLVDEIRWLEAQGNYVKIHAAGEAPLVRCTLKKLHERLDPSRFLRIHRSMVVNLDRVRELRPMFHGEYRILLDDGTELTSSRGLKETLRKVMGDRF